MTVFEEPSISILLMLWLRYVVAIRIIPLAGLGSIPYSASGGLAMGMAVLSLLMIGERTQGTPDLSHLWLMMTLEAGTGLIMGLSVAVCFSVFQMAGVLINETIIGNGSSADTAPWSRIHVVAGVLLFLVMGGHRAVFAALFGSLVILPPGHLLSGVGDGIDIFGSVVTGAFTFGVLLAAPLFVAAVTLHLFQEIVCRLSGSDSPGGASLRVLVLQLVCVGVLWKTLSVGIQFLSESIGTLHHATGI